MVDLHLRYCDAQQAQRALQILRGIPYEYVTNVLKMQSAPHDLCVLQSILVPPTCIRPATVTRNTKTDQDLTRSLVDIVKANAAVLQLQQQQQQHLSRTAAPATSTDTSSKSTDASSKSTDASSKSTDTSSKSTDASSKSTDASSKTSFKTSTKTSLARQKISGVAAAAAAKVQTHPKRSASELSKLVAETINKLQQVVSAYVDRDVSNTRARRTAGPQRQRQSLVDRFGGGKKGRMRSNMMGRRVNNCARFVIGPDALIDLWELRIPRSVAIETTREEVVGAHNFDEMCKCIRTGTSGIGGAQYVIMNDGTRANLKNLTPAATERVLQRLEYGCTVHRMLVTSDIGVFNRQPSLSKHSIMGHDVLPDRQGGKNSGRFPGNTCKPYNADFDGLFNLAALFVAACVFFWQDCLFLFSAFCSRPRLYRFYMHASVLACA